MKKIILIVFGAGSMSGIVLAASAAKGKETFGQCGVCHSADTDDRKFGPSLKGLFKHAKLANDKEVNEKNVRAKINEGGKGMPVYAEMLSDAEKDNLIAYLKTL